MGSSISSIGKPLKLPDPQWTEKTPDNVERMRSAEDISSRLSLRRYVQALRIIRENVRRILKGNLKFQSYKIVTVQQLFLQDFLQGEDFAIRMQVILQVNGLQ